MEDNARKQFFSSQEGAPYPGSYGTQQTSNDYHMGFTLPRDTISPPPLPTITKQPNVQSASQYNWTDKPTTAEPGTQTGTSWMNKPQTNATCPPGLEYLTMIDQLLIHQTTDTLQAAPGFETENQYYIANKNEQKVYYAKEKSDAFARNCCKAQRSFEMKVFDNFGKEVIHMNRPFACQAFCFFCCLQSMEVFSPPGTLIGTIEQEWNLFSSAFIIKNGEGEIALRIKGPCSIMKCCSNNDFRILSVDGETEVGKILKKSSDYAQELSSKYDNFGLLFPANLDVRMKAVLIGACFLIDMMYFEESTSNQQDTTPNQGHLSPI